MIANSSHDLDAGSLVRVLPDSRWIGACLARAQIAVHGGRDAEVVARELYAGGSLTLSRSREVVRRLQDENFISMLDPRKKVGSAENPVTKLFPAAVTERQFLDHLDALRAKRPTVDYRDERFSGHSLVEFTLCENGIELPINVKNAGTRFENAAQLVGLDPDDCIPIPAYKAHDALEKESSLLYAFSIDYALLARIEAHLLPLLDADEARVWKLLNSYAGALIRDAEDRFIYSTVNKYWTDFSAHAGLPAFRIISARKAIRILQTLPKRTPGVGLRAWGTGASAEVNVHVSVSTETRSWDEVGGRIQENGITDVIGAVNRKRTEVVFDPEI